MRYLFIASFFLFWPFAAGQALAQSSCGMAALTPVPPVGCQSMKPMCVCAVGGAGCQWQFICVPASSYSAHETRDDGGNRGRGEKH